jgi:hypothetical protein
MFDRDVIAVYCAQYEFDLVVSNETIWIDGAKFDSFEIASNAIKSIAKFIPIWLATHELVHVEDVEELLPEIATQTFDLQPLVAELPEFAVAHASLLDDSNVVCITLVAPHTRVTCTLRVESAALLAAVAQGQVELAYEDKALTISYVV